VDRKCCIGESTEPLVGYCSARHARFGGIGRTAVAAAVNALPMRQWVLLSHCVQDSTKRRRTGRYEAGARAQHQPECRKMQHSRQRGVSEVSSVGEDTGLSLGYSSVHSGGCWRTPAGIALGNRARLPLAYPAKQRSSKMRASGAVTVREDPWLHLGCRDLQSRGHMRAPGAVTVAEGGRLPLVSMHLQCHRQRQSHGGVAMGKGIRLFLE